MYLSPPLRPSTDKSCAEPKDVLQLLLASHEHIRSFTALAIQLGHAQGASPPDLSGTAARVITYFTQRLPQHFEAEDFALLPRLFTTAIPAEMMQHLWTLKLQHEAIEKTLAEFVPSWVELRDAPERYSQLAERLSRGGRRLLLLIEFHILMEEQYLFPLARASLPQETLEELAAEVLRGRDLLN